MRLRVRPSSTHWVEQVPCHRGSRARRHCRTGTSGRNEEQPPSSNAILWRDRHTPTVALVRGHHTRSLSPDQSLVTVWITSMFVQVTVPPGAICVVWGLKPMSPVFSMLTAAVTGCPAATTTVPRMFECRSQ